MIPSDPTPAPSPAQSLDTLRIDIDRIDAAMHGLLMERAEIIDRLIAVKARQGGGSAFRPGREASMMRALVARHKGILPLDTVEGIWRIIISTFTYVQAPYSVHADMAGGDAAMRDSARFHFGFTVPLLTHPSAKAVIAAVATASGDLGLVQVAGTEDGAWWDDLTDPAAPKIIARLPFVERADHAAALPLFVVAKPLADAAVSDVMLYGVDRALEMPPDDRIEVVASTASKTLVAVPGTVRADMLADALGMPTASLAFVGSHASRFEMDAPAAR